MVPLDPELATGMRTPEENHQQHELSETIERAVDTLSPELRVVIIMRHFEDLSYRKMGYILSIPEKTVKSRLYSARRRLAVLLTERGVNTGHKS